ncbi:MAG: hypothetical protein H7841_11845, partial [Magnetospirillum sp. WYHS-4]
GGAGAAEERIVIVVIAQVEGAPTGRQVRVQAGPQAAGIFVLIYDRIFGIHDTVSSLVLD